MCDGGDDWSFILLYDLDGWSYRLVRLNGPSPKDHRNHLTGATFRNVPHLHLATEAAQRRGLKEDNHAIPVGHLVLPMGRSHGFSTMADAVHVFARKAHVQAAQPGTNWLL